MQQRRQDLQPQQLYISHLSGNAAKQYHYMLAPISTDDYNEQFSITRL